MAGNMDLKENISEKEEEIKEQEDKRDNKSQEQEEKGIAMELLGELKTQNKRLIRVIAGLMVMIALIVGGFLLYLYQYDFSGTIEQSGVYTLVDSNGNVISSDITPDQMEEILKIINGKDENNEKKN